MTTLHMEIETTLDAALDMELQLGRMQDLLNELRAQLRRTQWESGARSEFDEKLSGLVNALILRSEDGMLLVRRLRREVDEWNEMASSLWGAPMQDRQRALDRIAHGARDHRLAHDEMDRRAQEYEDARQRTLDSDGIREITELKEWLQRLGITNPVLLNILSGLLYIIKHGAGLVPFYTLIEKIVKTLGNQDLTTTDWIEVAADGLGTYVSGGWEIGEQGSRIIDATSKYGEMQARLQDYMDAVKVHDAAEAEMLAAKDAMLVLDGQK